ncbi:MAG: dockerin type I repeat-containing protein [Planctomycetota bacterium]|nr:dockerin type I repeat-containing protein [Planctomycetota bacterium]
MNADLTSWWHFRGAVETVPGVITASVDTGFSKGGTEHSRGTPVYSNHYTFRTADETEWRGVSYATGRRGSSGAVVTIEYPAGKPQISRIVGMRTAAVEGWVFPLILLFPLIGVPALTENEALRFHFVVDPDSAASLAEIRFQDGAVNDHGRAVANAITARGETGDAELTSAFVFLNGGVAVLPDVILFARGDANGDDKVDVSDALTVLGYLFLGSRKPACFDAADANDDGEVAMSDAVAILGFLFLGEASPPAPYPDAGRDPTKDGLGCLYAHETP